MPDPTTQPAEAVRRAPGVLESPASDVSESPAGSVAAASGDASKSTEFGLTRRGFLTLASVGVGAATLGLGYDLHAAEEVEGFRALRRPRIGALYETAIAGKSAYWRGVAEVPWIGRYDLSTNGSIEKHLVFARQHAINYFLLSYRSGDSHQSQWKNIDRLFARTDQRGGIELGIWLLPDHELQLLQRAVRNGQIPVRTYLHFASEWLIDRCSELESRHGWLGRRSYLRGLDGRPVIAMGPLGDSRLTSAVLREVAHRRPELPRKIWLWQSGAPASSHLPQLKAGLTAIDGAFFCSRAQDRFAEGLALYGELGRTVRQRVVAVAPEPAHPDALSERLAAVRALEPAPHFVLVDSFNHWHAGNAIEPGRRFGWRHLRTLREWSRSWA